MKKYIAPSIEIVKLEATDIIAASGDFSIISTEEVDSSGTLSREVLDFDF